MKRRTYALIMKPLLLTVFILLWHLSAAGAGSQPPEPISLDVTNQPLSRVFDRLSQMTGLRFIYDRDWADETISVKIKNQDLDRALRKVLDNYNYGILYGDDGNVRIMIYGAKSDSAASPITASPSNESDHVGSAPIQEDDPADRQDIEENQTETDSADTAAEDRDDPVEANDKTTDEDTETGGEPSETETGEVDDGGSGKDPQETETPKTDTSSIRKDRQWETVLTSAAMAKTSQA